MKNFTLVVIATFGLCSSSYANSLKLKCWNKHYKDATAPFIIADIEYHNQLSNIRFIYKKSMAKNGITVQDHLDSVVAKEVVSNRSPYKGNQEFLVKGSGTLLLPKDISQENLKKTVKSGIYRNAEAPGENGVFITSYDEGDGAGSHVSYRLICESDI